MNYNATGQLHSVETARGLISRWTGFELRPSTPQRIYALLEGRCAALNFTDIDDYLHALSKLSATEEEPQRLINLITNGLTAFWRDDQQLEMLRTLMLEASTPKRPLHIWCAGCSTGEEPFTIAMLAKESGIDARIIGTDINTDFLHHAQQGIYGPWSLRRLNQERRQRFFIQNDAQSWEIHPELQSIVTFQQHNLLNPPAHSSELFENAPWDIILCRNVLIYLSTEATEKVFQHFSAALAHDGYLLLSSSELITNDITTSGTSLAYNTSPGSKAYFQAMRFGDSFVYKLRTNATDSLTSFPTNEPANPLKQHIKTHAITTPYNQEHHQHLIRDDFEYGEIPPPVIPIETCDLQEVTCELEDTHTVTNLLISAAQCLQNRQYDEAITTFEAAISYDPFVAEAYCLIGKALYESGAYQLASEAYRKALFLEPHNWFAASQMADLMMKLGVQDAAHQAWRQTIEGLDADSEPLADSYILLQFVKPLAEHRDHVRQLAKTYLQKHI